MSLSLEWMLIRGSGLVAYLLLAASVLWGLVLSLGVLPKSVKNLTLLHESLSVGALVATLVHMIGIAFDEFIDFDAAAVLVPGRAPWKPMAVAWGVAAFYGMVVVILSFYIRKHIGQSTWRSLHYLSFGVFLSALVHGLTAGTDSSNPLVFSFYAATGAAVVALVVLRIVMAGNDEPKPEPARAPAAGSGRSPGVPDPTCAGEPPGTAPRRGSRGSPPRRWRRRGRHGPPRSKPSAEGRPGRSAGVRHRRSPPEAKQRIPEHLLARSESGEGGGRPGTRRPNRGRRGRARPRRRRHHEDRRGPGRIGGRRARRPGPGAEEVADPRRGAGQGGGDAGREGPRATEGAESSRPGRQHPSPPSMVGSPLPDGPEGRVGIQSKRLVRPFTSMMVEVISSIEWVVVSTVGTPS